MDILMTMFKPRPSQSPVRSATKAIKKPVESPKPKRAKIENNNHVEEPPKFTYDQVKQMLEKMLEENDKNKKLLVSHGLRGFDFNHIAASGHSAEQCKELIDRLVKSTRRVRTLNEVLNDIKNNLDRKTYTEIIQRATLDKSDLPKRPPSAYLLYHQDRYHNLKQDIPLAAEVSKIVSDEWKNLSERKRREYQKRHNDLMRNYENEMKRLGLVDDVAPKRPGNARSLYIQERMQLFLNENEDAEDYSNEEMQQKFGAEFDELDTASKKYWNNIAKEKMDQFKQEQEEFTALHPHLKPKLVRAQRSNPVGRPKKSDVPQPPRSALKMYLEKKMPEGVEGEEAEDLKRRLKDKFTQLSQKKLLKFIKKAIKDKDRYKSEVELFLEQHPKCEDQLKTKDIKPNLTKEQWKLYSSMVENRPNMPAPTTYLYYCGKLLSDDTYSPGEDPTQRMQNASVSWRELSESERAKYEQEHMEIIENYINEMTDWLDEVDPERRRQVLVEEPRSHPDYWRKRVHRSRKAALKREQ